jgi:hypothetical protein
MGLARKCSAVSAAVGLLVLVLAVPSASASHLLGNYNGTHAQGGAVGLRVPGVFGSEFLFSAAAPMGKSDAGQDCVPFFPGYPLSQTAIVDHAFNDTIAEGGPGLLGFTLVIAGSFSPPANAAGTLRITSDNWSTPSGEQPVGSICDTGTVSWTATCTPLPVPCSAPMSPSEPAPTFSGSASRARTTRNGRVTVPLRIGCPPPGVDCGVSVAATARVRASASARRELVKLGRSHYVVKVGTSGETRFNLNAKGRRWLRRLRRIQANVELAVTRASSVTRKNITVRLKAPRRTR